MSDSPASFTRHRSPDLARPALTAISHRMKHCKKQSRTDDSECEPIRSSPRLPRKTHGNLSAGPSTSPKRNKRIQEQQRNKLYPDIPVDLQKQTRNLYPILHDVDDHHGDNDREDEDLGNEADSGDNSCDQLDSEKKVKTNNSPSVKQRAKNKPRNTVDSPNAIGVSRPRTDNVSLEGHHAQTQNYMISFMVFGVLLLAIVIGVAVVYMKQQRADDPQPTSSPVDYFKVYKPHLDEIREKYPSQSTRFWRTVSSSIRRLLTEGIDTYPAVLLFGIPKVHSKTGTCISRDIIKSLNEMFNNTNDGYINLENLTSNTPDKMKLDLDGRLIENLDNSKGIVLDHLERLPAQAALLLHGYCDGDNAPYKSATIILVLHTDKPLSDHDDVIEAILNDLWEGELGVDEMPALRSRIANSATVVKPELDVAC